MNRNKKQKQSTENSGAHENSLYIDQRILTKLTKQESITEQVRRPKACFTFKVHVWYSVLLPPCDHFNYLQRRDVMW